MGEVEIGLKIKELLCIHLQLPDFQRYFEVMSCNLVIYIILCSWWLWS